VARKTKLPPAVQIAVIVVVVAITYVGGCFEQGPEEAVSQDLFLHGMLVGASSDNQLVNHTILALSANPSTKLADWVAYRIEKQFFTGCERDPKRHWKADPKLADRFTLEPNDYTGARKAIDTDRGHQAPLGSFRCTDHYHLTNSLSHITPQDTDLNQGAWKTLEERVVRDFVEHGRMVWVLTGPLFERDMADGT
jgi:endonuclease G